MATDLKLAKNELQLAFLKLCEENSIELPLTVVEGATEVPTVEASKGSVTVTLQDGYTHNGSDKLAFKWNVITKAKAELFPKVEAISFDVEESKVTEEQIIAAAKISIAKAFIHPLDAASVTFTYEAGQLRVDFNKSAIIRSATQADNVLLIPVSFKEVDPKDLTDVIKRTNLDAFTAPDLAAE